MILLNKNSLEKELTLNHLFLMENFKDWICLLEDFIIILVYRYKMRDIIIICMKLQKDKVLILVGLEVIRYHQLLFQ